MTEQLRRTSLTADAFLEWAMEQPNGRFELIDGEVVAMAPERVGHARTKFRATTELAAAVAKAGLGWEALVGGVAVRIDDRTVFEPDALVRCGPPLPDDAI
jgi:Uma2 family endonuclease